MVVPRALIQRNLPSGSRMRYSRSNLAPLRSACSSLDVSVARSSGCTTPRGKLIFGLAAGVLAYLIRVFGAYPDGVAFSVLLLNLCAPLIDVYTQPPIFGHKKP